MTIRKAKKSIELTQEALPNFLEVYLDYKSFLNLFCRTVIFCKILSLFISFFALFFCTLSFSID